MLTEGIPTQEIRAQDVEPNVDITEYVTLDGLKPMWPETRFVLRAQDVDMLYVEIHAKPKEDGEEQEVGYLPFPVDPKQLRLPKLTFGFADLCTLLNQYYEGEEMAAVVMVHLLAQRGVRLRIGFEPETYQPDAHEESEVLDSVELNAVLTIGDTAIDLDRDARPFTLLDASGVGEYIIPLDVVDGENGS
jgi:hypothetical protein